MDGMKVLIWKIVNVSVLRGTIASVLKQALKYSVRKRRGFPRKDDIYEFIRMGGVIDDS